MSDLYAMSDPYEMWDAAYVLGSLSSTERRQYEMHLAGCKRCRTAVNELSGMPALLALLDRDQVSDDARMCEPPPLRSGVLDALLERVSRRRRRSRQLIWALTAVAAAILAMVVVVTVWPTPGESPTQIAASPLTMSQVKPSDLTATVTLTSHGWGTNIDMTCTYRDAPGDQDSDDAAGDRLAMVAVGRDGSRVQLSTWMVKEGVRARPSASTSLRLDEIAAVQVVSADTGDVLLQQNL